MHRDLSGFGDPNLTDEDNPEWTEEDFARARPASELPPEVCKPFTRTRGRLKKADAEIIVSVSIDPDFVDSKPERRDGSRGSGPNCGKSYGQ